MQCEAPFNRVSSDAVSIKAGEKQRRQKKGRGAGFFYLVSLAIRRWDVYVTFVFISRSAERDEAGQKPAPGKPGGSNILLLRHLMKKTADFSR